MASHSFSYTAVTLMFSTVEWTVEKTIPLKIFCFFLTNTMKDKACVTLPAFFLSTNVIFVCISVSRIGT